MIRRRTLVTLPQMTMHPNTNLHGRNHSTITPCSNKIYLILSKTTINRQGQQAHIAYPTFASTHYDRIGLSDISLLDSEEGDHHLLAH